MKPDLNSAYNGYTILERIVKTHEAEVYRAVKTGETTPVIIKTLGIPQPSPAQMARFRHEYELIRKADIDGIIKTVDFVDDNGKLALVLEDFGGVSLKELLPAGFTLERFFKLAIRLAEILGALHSKNIFHRDIKPSNILVNPKTDVVRISDFGIASEMLQQNDGIAPPVVMEGTLAYVSPEQTGRMNCPVDYRTDLYSLGITFYEMLTGQTPFQSVDALEMIHAHIAREPVPPNRISPKIPPILSDIVLKLLSKSAGDRYQSSFGLAADLRECLQQWQKTGWVEPFTLGRQDMSLQFIIPRNLVGRKKELAALHAAFDRVGLGAVEVVFVSGEPGIGKSALVAEIAKPIVEKRGYFATGKFEEFNKTVPYSAIIQAFQGLVRQLLAESDDRLLKWKERLLAALGVNGRIITEAIPAVERIIGKQPDVPDLGPEETQNRFNLVFKNFVRVFANARHPLVIFLDDFQWSDPASTQLCQTIALDRDLGYLLFIGAYRDSEVPLHHPLFIARDAVRSSGLPVHTLHLENLQPVDINQLLCAFLRGDPDASLPLAETISAKTKGSPFFVHEFLKTLYDRHLLTCDPARGWAWDLQKIRALQVTDNVVQFMAHKLHLLSSDPLELIELCACIGNRFDLETLALITARPLDKILSLLDTLLQEGLIYRTGSRYRFQHDRIQEAAYSLLTPSDRERIHYRIGNLFLKLTPEHELSSHAFFICDQLNEGYRLLPTQTERTRLAELNLMAGIKAKESTAYASAVSYLARGIDLLAQDAWKTNYDLSYALFTEQMECRYLNRNFDEAERLFGIIIDFAATKVDKARAYNIMIVLYSATRTPREAIELGIKALRIFGLDFKIDVGAGPVLMELMKARYGLKKIGLDKIMDLPRMQDKNLLAVNDLLLSIGVPAYYVNPRLLAYICLKAVNGYLKNGLVPQAAAGFIGIANIIQNVPGDYKLACRLGEMAIKLNAKLDNRKIAGSLLHSFAFFISHWTKPLRNELEMFARSYELSINAGDFIYAGHSITAAADCRLKLDYPLDDVLDELNKYQDFMALSRDPLITSQHRHVSQVIMALKGLTPVRSDSSGDGFSETELLDRFRRDGNYHGLCFSLYFRVLLLNAYRRYNEALEAAVEIDRHISVPLGTMLVACHYFTYSLILIALLREGASDRQRKYKAIIRRNQRKLAKWSSLCPENFKPMSDLVAAELAGLEGRFQEALQFYHAAIAGAHENGFLQIEAMACELLADFYLKWHYTEEAGLCIRRAHRCFAAWGATAKEQDLQERYPDFLREDAVNRPSDTAGGTTSSESALRTLDLAAVAQVSQVISGEIELDRLLQQTMHMSITSAGAERGYLILESHGKLFAHAREDVKSGTDLKVIPLDDCEGLSKAIVHYVYHSGEDLILGNAFAEGAFRTDPHIHQHQCKSILCLPILNKGRLVGILYMENNLTAYAFTPERLEILRVISAQAAISLRNAQLYENVSREIAERKKMEIEIRQSEERYRNIIETIQDGYFEIDLAGRYTLVNDVICQHLQYSREELIGSDNRKYQTEENAKIAFREFANVLLTGNPVKAFLMDVVRKDGSKQISEVSISLIRNEQGQPVGFRGTSRDVTDRINMENEMRQSEERYRNIIETIQDGYLESDDKGRWTFMNDVIAQHLGYTREELLGKTSRHVQDETNFKKTQHVFSEIYKTGKPAKLLELEFLRKDKTTGFYELSVSLMKDATGKPVGFRSISRDITERKRLEHDLLDSYKKVQTARVSTILGLAKLAEYRDEATGAHLERIREYARILALELSKKPEYTGYITPEYIEDIYNSAILHDIGKVGVPDAILLKPAKLDPMEFEVIKTHATLGGDALRAVEAKIEGQSFLTLGKEIAYHHHEKWDGTGYPKGLKGEEIPLSARIVALADVYDALTSKRTYKEAFSHEQALEIIRKDRGTHFAPDVVDAFVAHAEDFRRIREEMLGE